MTLITNSKSKRERNRPEVEPPESVLENAFFMLGKWPFVILERLLPKRQFCSFVEKDWDLDPRFLAVAPLF